METTTITASELRERMAARGVRVGDLAREAGLYPTDVSQILAGRLPCGPRRAARLALGIIRLGLDREDATPPPPAEPVVIRIRRT